LTKSVITLNAKALRKIAATPDGIVSPAPLEAEGEGRPGSGPSSRAELVTL
jgi:hypothetical protein